MADNETKFSVKSEIEKFQTTQTLPIDGKELGRMVYAMYRYSLDSMKPWYTSSDRNRLYYRGEARPIRPAHKSNINHNVIRANIETAKPVLESALIKPGIYAVKPSDVKISKSLEQRTALAWKESSLQYEHASKLLHDILVDGTAYLKGDAKNLTINLEDNRQIMHDPNSASMDKGLWICHFVLDSVGSIRKEYGKSPEASTRELESKEDAPEGAPGYSEGADGSFNNPGVDNAAAKSFTSAISSVGNHDFQKSERVLKIEMWVRDITDDEKGNMKYPEGRIVTIGVGTNSEGTASDGKDPEIMVLADINNPFVSYYEKTQRFPFIQLQGINIGEVWGLGEVHNQIDGQDMINDIINQLHDNIKLVNSPRTIASRLSGITEEQLTNTPGETIVLETSENPSRAVHVETPPPIAAYTLPVLQAYLRLNEQDSGAGEVLAGRRPAGVQSGTAITALQDRADNKFIFIARNINTGFVKAYMLLACMIQDFDEEVLFIPVEDPGLDAIPEDQFTKHDPAKVKSIAFRVEATRKMKQEVVIQLMDLATKMDAAVPGAGLGGVILDYSEDKHLRNLYKEQMVELKEATEKAQKEQAAAELEKQEADMAKEITLAEMDNQKQAQQE